MVVDVESYIYGPDTLISEFTNKPISDGAGKSFVFWCDICQLKMKTVHRAILHLGGKFHRGKKIKHDMQNKDYLKRVSDVHPSVRDKESIEPANKKSKPGESDQNLACDDCNLQFNSSMMAIQHFKGKKHALKVAAKLEAKKSKWQGPFVGVGNLRGMGRGVHGRVEALSRLSGLTNSVASLVRGTPANQLSYANSITVPGYSSWATPIISMQRNDPHTGFGAVAKDWYNASRQRDTLFHSSSATHNSLSNTLSGSDYYWPR